MQRAGIQYDAYRGNIALARLATALGVRLDSSRPDHELLEQLAEAATRLAEETDYLRERTIILQRAR